MFELNAAVSSFLNNKILFWSYIQDTSVCMFGNVRDYNTCGEKKFIENQNNNPYLNKSKQDVSYQTQFKFLAALSKKSGILMI